MKHISLLCPDWVTSTRESLDQVRDLGFHVMVTANCKGQLWTQHGAGLAATLGSEVVAADRMDDEQVRTPGRVALDLHREDLWQHGASLL